MNLQLFFIFGILFGVVSAEKAVKTKETLIFSIKVIWISIIDEHNCKKEDWEEGVNEYVDETTKVANDLPGPTFDLGASVMTSFKIFVDKLTEFTTSNSTILSSNSTAVLRALSKLQKLSTSPTIIIKEFNNSLPGLINDYKTLVTSLSGIIGELTDPINQALSDLQISLTNYSTEFLTSGSDAGKISSNKTIDFKLVDKHTQVLVNTIARIAKTTLNNCELDITATHEAITVLSLILIHLIICVEGVSICSQAILVSSSLEIPEALSACTKTMEPLLKGLTDSVAAINTPSAESVKNVSTNIINLTAPFNASFKELLGLCDHVELTVQEITKILRNVLHGSQK